LSSHENWCDGTGLSPRTRSKSSKSSKKKIDTNETCEYGCGEKAKWSLKSGKLCCSEYASQCLSVRKKNSDGVKKAWEKGSWDIDDIGGGWNKGLSWKEMYDEKTFKSRLKWAKNESVIANLSSEECSKYGKLGGGGGGYRKKSGRSNGQWYESPIAGEVWLDSSYELAYAKWLDENDVRWERNTKKFDYLHEGEAKKYVPDFYLLNEEIYVEIKGFKTDKDEAKWEHFEHKLVVYYKEDLIELGCDLS